MKKPSVALVVATISVIILFGTNDTEAVLVNPNFETGYLSPWVGEDWHIVSTDSHSGTYSAMTQTYLTTLTQELDTPIFMPKYSELTLTFWVRHPDSIFGGTIQVSTIYDNSIIDIYRTCKTASDQWEYFELKQTVQDDTYLTSVKFLSDGSTYLDDVVIVPEPITLLLLGLGGIILRKRPLICNSISKHDL